MRNLLAFLILVSSMSIFAQENSMHFDDNGDFIEIPGASALIAGGNISMTFWVYLENDTPGFPDFDGVAGIRNNISADFYILQLSNSNYEARFRNSLGNEYTMASPGVELNSWHHLALTYNGSMLTFYKNGTVLSSIPASGVISSFSESFQMGKTNWSSFGFLLEGRLDEVSLWNRSLSAEEVQCIYEHGLSYPQSGLQLLYNFNQGIPNGNNVSITTIIDDAGANGNEAVIHGLNMTGATSNFVDGVVLDELEQTVAVISAQCNGENGEIHFGNSGAEYSIDGGATWQSDSVFVSLPVGMYTACSRNNGCIVCDTISLTEPSAIGLSITQSPPSCNGGENGEIHIDMEDGIEYSFDGGSVWQVDSFFTSAGAGQYVVCGRNSIGCETCTDVEIIDPNPVIVIGSSDTIICENSTAYLSAFASGGSLFTFDWDIDSSNNTANQEVSPTTSSSYVVTAQNEYGCVSSPDTINVTVLPPLSGNITPEDTICPGLTTSLASSVTGGLGEPYTFVWGSGDAHTGVGNHTITVAPQSVSNYTVTISDECTSTPLELSTTVHLVQLEVPTVEVVNNDQCEPAKFELINATPQASGQGTYWLIDGTHEYTNQDTILTPIFMSGAYDVQMITTSSEGCVDSVTLEGLLLALPKPVADFHFSPEVIKMFSTEVFFTNTSSFAESYEWFFESGNPATSNERNEAVIFPEGITGTYNVQLVASSEYGCRDTIIQTITILPDLLIFAPNSFTPNGDEHNQNWRVYMDGIDIHDFQLLIFDRWGELIWESRDIHVPWDGTYHGSPVPSGTYNWMVRTKDQLNDGKYVYQGHVTILR